MMPSAPPPLPAPWQAEGLLLRLLALYARRVPGHPAKLRFVRAWERRLRRKIIRHPGGGLLHLDGTDYIDWSLLTTGHFEPRSLALAIKLMNPGGVMLDVGANHGLFSIAVSAATGCQSVAVEPEPAIYCRLLENLALNPDLAITPVHCCATPAPMLVQLETPPPGHGAWTRVHRGKPTARSPRVAGLSLASIIRELEITAVRLLKIDIEGYEPEAMKGLDWTGSQRPKYVLMECDPAEDEKLEFLRSRGYVATTVTGEALVGLSHFPEGNLLFVDETAPR